MILNVGGWNKDRFILEEEKIKKYQLCSEVINKFIKKYPSIEFLIQTMPPFPWHLGGRSHHNLFVSPKEISDFCNQNNVSICLDTSHAIMSCNYLGIKFKEYIDQILDFTKYMHIADAKGEDGEGVQIGDGDIDIQSSLAYYQN